MHIELLIKYYGSDIVVLIRLSFALSYLVLAAADMDFKKNRINGQQPTGQRLLVNS